jgi:glutamyl-tRNA(Gln) amidotransferase subunit D
MAAAAASSPAPAWAPGQTTDLGKVKDLMLTPIAGEITEREPYKSYLIFL